MIWILPAGEEAQCLSELEWPFCLPAHKDHSSALSGTDVVPALPVPAVLGRSLGGGEVAGQEGFLQGRGPARALPNPHTPRARPAFQGGENPAAETPGWQESRARTEGHKGCPPRTPPQNPQPLLMGLAHGDTGPSQLVQGHGPSQWGISKPGAKPAGKSQSLASADQTSLLQRQPLSVEPELMK